MSSVLQTYRARSHRIQALSLYNRLAREKVAKAKREEKEGGREGEEEEELRKRNRTSHKG